VTERPDWIAEVLSSSTASRDLGDMLTLYHASGVPHSWVVDPQNRTLLVYRRLPDGYVVALGAGSDKAVRAEPFEALELRVGLLFGDEEDVVGRSGAEVRERVLLAAPVVCDRHIVHGGAYLAVSTRELVKISDRLRAIAVEDNPSCFDRAW
jgi:Putative restriction endonuclease